MSETETLVWPPQYTLRISRKAKRINLRILPHSGLEIVIPQRQQKYIQIESVLQQFKDWIVKHYSKINIAPKQHITQLDLTAINETWQIHYTKTLSSQLRAICNKNSMHNSLSIYGVTEDIARTHAWLQKWLKQRAKETLLPWLESLSAAHNLPYNKATIRGQQTLWGSCSPEHDISLNYKLLFLRPELVTHILLHELCHTKHLNHSKRFWGLLAKLDPNCAQHESALRQVDILSAI